MKFHNQKSKYELKFFRFFYAKQLLLPILRQSEHAYLLICYTIMMKQKIFNFCVYKVYN
jgi:hypothetical protein